MENTINERRPDYGIRLESEDVQPIAQGVTFHKRVFRRSDGNPVKAYLVVLQPHSPARISVTAAPQGKTKLIMDHFLYRRSQGHHVIAAINSGYFHLKAKTYTSYGMQIIDQQVIKEPNGGAERYGDNWFGRTKDGQYVIGDTQDYQQSYRDQLICGAGGGDILLKNGKNTVPESTAVEPRSGVAVTEDGGVIFGVIDGRSEQSAGASYTDELKIFMSLGLPLRHMMNLDGGGSSVLVIGAQEPKIVNDPALDPYGLRPVADVLLLELPVS